MAISFEEWTKNNLTSNDYYELMRMNLEATPSDDEYISDPELRLEIQKDHLNEYAHSIGKNVEHLNLQDALQSLGLTMKNGKLVKVVLFNNKTFIMTKKENLEENIRLSEMGWTVRKHLTGLPVNIYVDDTGEMIDLQHHLARMKFQPNTSDSAFTRTMIPMSIDTEPEILIDNPEMEINSKQLKQIKNFVRNNKELLLQVGKQSIYSDEALPIMIKGGDLADENTLEHQKAQINEVLQKKGKTYINSTYDFGDFRP